MASSLNSLTLRLPLRPSRPAKVKKVVTTVSMAVSSSVSGSAAIRVELMSSPADLRERGGERGRLRTGHSAPALGCYLRLLPGEGCMEKEQADRVEAWGREYLSAGGERSVHSRNPFLSRSHNLGVLLKCLCLRDPSVMVPHSGDPSVQEEAFNVRVPLGSLSVSWPLCRVQQQGPCLESHPASKGQEVVCLQSLFV